MLSEPFCDFLEDVGHRLLLHGAIPANVAVTRRHVDFNVGNAGPVLSPVYLLVHEQIELVSRVEGCFILVNVILIRLPKANEGNTTFVFNSVAHSRLAGGQVIICG